MVDNRNAVANNAPMKNADIIEAIDKHCLVVGLKPSTVCRQLIGNGYFYKRMKEGKRAWPETIDRLFAGMKEQRKQRAPDT